MLAVAGVVIGIITGFTGVGAGVLVVPGLVLLFGLTIERARAASLIIMLAAALSGTLVYGTTGQIAWPAALLAAFGAITGAIGGASLMRGRKSPVYAQVVAFVLFAAGVYMLLGPIRHSAGHISPFLVLLVGLFSGVMGGVAGMASGALLVPMLAIFFFIPQKGAQAIALATVIPASLPGVLMQRSKGAVDGNLWTIMGSGAAAGSFIGAAIAVHANQTLLTILFGAFLVLMSATILLSGKKSGRSKAEHRSSRKAE